MTLLTFVFNDVIVPRANLAATISLQRALGKAIATEGKRQHSLLPVWKSAAERWYVRSCADPHLLCQGVYQGVMYEVTLIDFSRPDYRQMLTAKFGRWNESEGMWEFNDGRTTNIDDLHRLHHFRQVRSLLSIRSHRIPMQVAKLAHRCQHDDSGSGPHG